MPDPIGFGALPAMSTAPAAADIIPIGDADGGVAGGMCTKGIRFDTLVEAIGEEVGGVEPVTAGRALVSDEDGLPAASAVTATELGRISGVTSAVQTQLDGKASASHTHAQSDVTGLAAALAGKADSAHTHAYADLTGKPTLGTAAALDSGSANGVASLGSDGKVPTSQLPAAVLGAASYQGTWNATTNSPTIPAASSGNKGHYYKVATAGTTTIDGISEWAVGDWIISNGSTWDKVDNTETVSSVAGRTGAVTLTKSDVGLSAVPNTDCTNASNLASGTVPTARLGSGTADNTKFLRGDQTWQTPSGGGGTLLEGLAIVAPGGSDLTGAVGTSSAAPIPFATAQAAVNAGAKALELMPKSGSYGNISVNANLLLTIYSHGYGHLANQIGNISTNGYALALYLSSARDTLTVANIDTRATNGNSGETVLRNVWCLGLCSTYGNNNSTPGGNGRNGGALNAENCRFGGALSTSGGIAAAGDALQAGGTGGNGGNITAKRCIFEAAVTHSGGAGADGGAGDSENEGASGGGGGSPGNATFEDCSFLSGALTGNGASAGGGGADGGLGAGAPGSGSSAASVSMTRCTGGQDVNLVGGYGSGGVGGGGGLTLSYSHVGNVETPDGDNAASGNMVAEYSSFGTTNNTASTSGKFVVANGTPETTWGS